MYNYSYVATYVATYVASYVAYVHNQLTVTVYTFVIYIKW